MIQLLSLLYSVALLAPAEPIQVEVLSSTTGGKVYLAVYDNPDDFDEEVHLVNASTELAATADRAELALQLPEAGRYVLAAFQDLNGNGKLDRNFFGVPTEPYGFSKLPPTKWRAPSFGELATKLEGSDRVKIEMRRWSEY